MDELGKKIEALLFLKGEPVSVAWLAKILDAAKEEISAALDALGAQLSGRGIRLVRNGDQAALATAPEYSAVAQSAAKEEYDSELSKASLETLSIIIYKGAASRTEIDYIRGVNSSFILRNLQIRGLIEREDKRASDNAYVYKPAMELLRYLGITGAEQLPDYASTSAKLKEFLTAREAADEPKNVRQGE